MSLLLLLSFFQGVVLWLFDSVVSWVVERMESVGDVVVVVEA